MLTAVRASISTPVCAAIFAEAVMTMRSRVLGMAKSTSQCVRGRGWHRGMSSPVFLAARMPANRAVARTLPLAMVWDSMSLSVAFCNRTSPLANASRNITGLAETSTMLASPRASMCVSLFILTFYLARLHCFHALFPGLDHCSHLLRSVKLGLYMLKAEPGQHAQQIGRDQN